MAITRNGQIACIMQAMMGEWVVGGKHLTLVIHYWVDKIKYGNIRYGATSKPNCRLVDQWFHPVLCSCHCLEQ